MTKFQVPEPDHERRQPTLVMRWETRTFWIALAERIRCTETQAAIILDVWQNAKRGEPWTSYSRDRSFYSGIDSRLMTYRRVVSGVDELDERGLVAHDRRSPTPRGCGWQSALRLTPELSAIVDEVVAGVGRLVPARPERLVELRDENGLAIPFAATRETKAMERFLREMNEGLRATSIRAGVESLDACIHRIFNVHFGRGGRAYALGGAWQSIPEEQRLTITLDGLPTAELDVKGMHLSMLYAEAGIELNDDPYRIGDWSRDLAKVGCLVLINAADVHQAAWSIARKKVMGSVAEPGSAEAEAVARRLVADIRERHAAIGKAFASDAGARLMRRESDIIATVMSDILSRGHVTLPMHDGLIVRETAAGVLEESMRRAIQAAGLPSPRIETKVSATVEKEGLDSNLFNGLVRERSDIMLSLSLPPLQPRQNQAPLLEASLLQDATPGTSDSTFQDTLPGERSSPPPAPPKADDTTESCSLPNPTPPVQDVPICPTSTYDDPERHDVAILGTLLPRLSRSSSSIVLPLDSAPVVSQPHLKDGSPMAQPDLLSSTSPSDAPTTLHQPRSSHEPVNLGKVPCSVETRSEPPPVASSGQIGWRQTYLSTDGTVKLHAWSAGELDSDGCLHGDRKWIIRLKMPDQPTVVVPNDGWFDVRRRMIALAAEHGLRLAYNGRYDTGLSLAENEALLPPAKIGREDDLPIAVPDFLIDGTEEDQSWTDPFGKRKRRRGRSGPNAAAAL